MAKLGCMVDGSPGRKVSRWRSVYKSPACRVARLAGGEGSMSLQVAGSPGLQVERFTNKQVSMLTSR